MAPGHHRKLAAWLKDNMPSVDDMIIALSEAVVMIVGIYAIAIIFLQESVK